MPTLRRLERREGDHVRRVREEDIEMQSREDWILWLVCMAIEQAMRRELQTPWDFEQVARCFEKQARIVRMLGHERRKR